MYNAILTRHIGEQPMPVPVGTVRLFVNGSATTNSVPVDASGNYALAPVSNLAVGTDVLSTVFSPGDNNSLGSQSPNLNEVVTPIPQPQPTQTTINATPNPVVQGQAVQVSGNVSFV